MSRKDYVRAAEMLASIARPENVPDNDWGEEFEASRQVIGRRIADFFEDDNPNFDRERFYLAAGIEQ